VGGLDSRLTTLLCKQITVRKTGLNLAESSKEGYGSKKGCFASDVSGAILDQEEGEETGIMRSSSSCNFYSSP
jgi:hypothetical protein